MLGVFSLMFGFDDDPNKIWVFLKISPRPRLHVDWEIINLALSKCGIKDFRLYQPTDNAVFHMEMLSTCIAIQIPGENVLFLNGKHLQARLCFAPNNEYLIPLHNPLDDLCAEVTTNNSGGENEYAPEIKLVLCAPRLDAKELQHIERREQAKTRRCKQWQKILCRCLKPFQRWFEPLDHVQPPNT
jgi:L-rhamnose mutarotase